MNVTIAKEWAFSASHQLTHLPLEHPCARLHGHNYVVRVAVTCSSYALEPATGFVLDYRALDEIGDWVKASFDHRHLNEVLGDDPRATTAEALATIIAKHADLVLAVHRPRIRVAWVEVSETPKTIARVEP
jgi:6-pyruvoyltetrahydropterin/6-carboxytetrahydropterin synthase